MSHYQSHSDKIRAAARRRLTQRPIQPVMLRERDPRT